MDEWRATGSCNVFGFHFVPRSVSHVPAPESFHNLKWHDFKSRKTFCFLALSPYEATHMPQVWEVDWQAVVRRGSDADRTLRWC